MPELPEVETIKEGINDIVQGKVFEDVEIIDKKVALFSKQEFEDKIKGQELDRAIRRAKILIIKTKSKYGLMIHLKMTGQVIVEDRAGKKEGGGHPDKAYSGKKLPHKYTKIIFRFDDGSKMYFNDLRRFGWIKIVDLNNLDQLPQISKLGPEPFSNDFNPGYLEKVFERRERSNIKNLLMDQSAVAGIGNIYASEALFLAGIDPRRKAGSISNKEIEKIYQSVKKVLKKAIEVGGTSSDSYVDARGEQGDYLKQAYVYGREGATCRRKECHGEVEKIKINNRGTYFCSRCQS